MPASARADLKSGEKRALEDLERELLARRARVAPAVQSLVTKPLRQACKGIPGLRKHPV